MYILVAPPTDEQAKRIAHALLETARGRLIRSGRRALLLHLLANGTATAGDVRAAVPTPPGVNPKAFGPVPGPLARSGIIRKCGFATTARHVANVRTLLVWELADRDKAMAWLTANPELPDVAEGGVE